MHVSLSKLIDKRHASTYDNIYDNTYDNTYDKVTKRVRPLSLNEIHVWRQ